MSNTIGRYMYLIWRVTSILLAALNNTLAQQNHIHYSINQVSNAGMAILEEIGKDHNWGLQLDDRKIAFSLSAEQILACITCHFRCDHFAPDDFLRESVYSGRLLMLYEVFLKKTGKKSKNNEVKSKP